jgi:hypothetical protein
MANLVISGDTSGSVTLAAPAVSGTTVLTLPTTTGTLVVTGGAQTIEFADGTVSAPSITNSGDTNTGIFFPAADTIAFTEGGVESMRIDSSANVGIGTSSISRKFEVHGAPVSIGGSATGMLVSIVNNTTAFNSSPTSGMSFFTRFNTAGGTFPSCAIQGNKENATDGNYAGFMSFFTTDGGGGVNERMRIDSAGQVGIGTSSPAFSLDVRGDGIKGRFGNTTIGCTLGTYVSGTLWGFANNGGNGGMFGDASNYIYFASAGAERMRIDSSGNLLVGVTSGNGKVRIKQSADSHNNTLVIENFGNTNTWSFLVGSDNNLYLGYNGTSKGNFNNSTGAYTSTSDLRLKKNIETISHGLESVLALNPVSYNFKDETDESQQHLGFIAQEAQDILPSSVSAFADGTLGMDKQEIIPVLVKAIQELNAKVTALEKQLGAK